MRPSPRLRSRFFGSVVMKLSLRPSRDEMGHANRHARAGGHPGGGGGARATAWIPAFAGMTNGMPYRSESPQ
jgi:hypothetical protein